MAALAAAEPSASERPGSAELCAELGTRLASSLPGCAARIESMGPESPVSDGTYKLLVRDARGRSVAVVLCSSAGAPGMVARAMGRAREAKQTLGPDLGRVIFDPIEEGEVFGLSYAALPWCKPLSNSRLLWRFQRAALRPALCAWLRSAASVSLREPARARESFGEPLEHLAGLEAMPAEVRHCAERALQGLESGRFPARHVLTHNDLWKANILTDPGQVTGLAGRPWRERFVLIDWPGARVEGYGLYDLLRVADSLGLRRAALRAEVASHCRILGCELGDASAHLAAALGAIGMNLEQFPMSGFVRIANMCFGALKSIGAHVSGTPQGRC